MVPRRSAIFLALLTLAVFPGTSIAENTTLRDAARRYARDAAKGRDKIPSFARQTGMACSVCHNSFLRLTPFGRRFKLSGYTLTTTATITAGDSTRETLRLPTLPPVSAMLEGSFTTLKQELPETQNNNVAFPDQLSVFLAGAVAPNLGAFVQVTYAGTDGAIGIDNIDIRYARQAALGSQSLIYGLTLNNSPTVQDVWNTTSAWGFPYASSPVAPTPSAATQIDGALAQASAGLGAYALWADLLYTEFSVYRSAPQGGPNPPDPASEGTLDGIAPYWRVALQRSFGSLYAMVGTYGLRASRFPIGVDGPRDTYTDVGLDGQLEWPIGPGTMLGHATWIHEDQTLDATFAGGGVADAANSLSALRVDGSYILNAGLALTLGFFETTGDADSVLYVPEAVVGSATGRPDSRGLIGELEYSPWLNTHLTLQYVLYDKFNGTGANYDGSGRSASDNNTLYLLLWLAF